MRFILLLSLFLVGCTDKDLIKENSKKLCTCQRGLWYIDGDNAKCNNGVVFFDVDKIEVYDSKCD
jgi:hypothetical protein